MPRETLGILPTLRPEVVADQTDHLEQRLLELGQQADAVYSTLKPFAKRIKHPAEYPEESVRYLQVRQPNTAIEDPNSYIANVLLISFGNRRSLTLCYNEKLDLQRPFIAQLDRFQPLEDGTYTRTRVTATPPLGTTGTMDLEVSRWRTATDKERVDPHDGTLCNRDNDYPDAEQHITAFSRDLKAAELLFSQGELTESAIAV